MMFGGAARYCERTSAFSEQDWDNYRMVTVRKANPGETPTAFWDMATLRTSDELVVLSDRVGFMTTPAFFANWDTNDSNQFRVLANQTLIVALHQAFEPEGSPIPVDDAILEAEHAAEGTVCFGCHVTLDPMRDFFKQSYSLFYGPELREPAASPDVPDQGTFLLDATNGQTSGQGMGVLGSALAAHPDMAMAWTQKICELANFGNCNHRDVDLKAAASAFSQSNFDFNVLVKSVMLSAAITAREPSRTATSHGLPIGLAHQEALCQRLGERLQIPDICGRSRADKKQLIATHWRYRECTSFCRLRPRGGLTHRTSGIESLR